VGIATAQQVNGSRPEHADQKLFLPPEDGGDEAVPPATILALNLDLRPVYLRV
jgi:hypothetical protein